MKLIAVMMALVMAAGAETTLDWAFEGYTENEAFKTVVSAPATAVDATVAVEAEATGEITTLPLGMLMILR